MITIRSRKTNVRRVFVYHLPTSIRLCFEPCYRQVIQRKLTSLELKAHCDTRSFITVFLQWI